MFSSNICSVFGQNLETDDIGRRKKEKGNNEGQDRRPAAAQKGRILTSLHFTSSGSFLAVSLRVHGQHMHPQRAYRALSVTLSSLLDPPHHHRSSLDAQCVVV